MSTVLDQTAPRYIVCDGNEAAAWGVKLARPDMIAVYPITPQSSLVEALAKFAADGIIDADMAEAEGEHSVLSLLQGAALAGGRTYTATSGPGLAFMFEPYWRTPGLRLPLVMSLVTRDGITPQTVWGGHQDAMTVREAGWIQIYCEDAQEVLDTVVMAYRIAEHRDVMLPVNVCHDGNYLSFGASRIELPDQGEVDAYLGPKNVNWHAALDPARPMAIDPLTGGASGNGPATFVRYRKGQCQGMQNALRVIAEAHAEWGERFGRQWAPLVEEYRLADADYAIVTLGSMTGAAKDAVDAARQRGEKVGLIKVKTYRPFPVEALHSAAAQVKALGVVDRSVSFGWNCGPLYQDVLGALHGLPERIPTQGFIGGLSGADLTIDHFTRVIAATARLQHQGQATPGAPGDCQASTMHQAPGATVWLNEHD